MKNLIFTISLIACPLSAFAQQRPNPDFIAKSVAKCVAYVNKQADKLGYDEGLFYKQFDAFYNQSTERIQNSAIRNGDQKPLFMFEKCMAQSGLPLGSK